MKRQKQALFTVHDKRPEFASLALKLIVRGWKIYATGGTHAFIKRSAPLASQNHEFLNSQLRLVEEVTGFPEAEDGSVKTLSPKLHDLIQNDGIDLVCVTLKPEDVGGVALIRSAIKGGKVVITNPEHWEMALDLALHGNDAIAAAELAAEANVHLISTLLREARALTPGMIDGSCQRTVLAPVD